MKKYLTLFAIVLAFGIISCNSGTDKTAGKDTSVFKITSLDTAFLLKLNSLTKPMGAFGDDDDDDDPVDEVLAEECVAEFLAKMKLCTQWGTATTPKLTHSVGFDLAVFRDWVTKLPPEVYKLRLRFGVYTSRLVHAYNASDTLIGRMTVFVWPYKKSLGKTDDDETAGQPYNLGEIKP